MPKSGTLFDQVANIFRGTTKADTVKYYQAKSYYGQRDYMMAGYYFSELSVHLCQQCLSGGGRFYDRLLLL